MLVTAPAPTSAAASAASACVPDGDRAHGHLAGLDGLRAIAVALVVVYHLFPWLGLESGFVGVDVFFVISGFLITTLLVREHARDGRIGLRRFWLRRARRLLPALALVVLTCASLAWVIGGDVLTRIGAQIAGAATFSYNWVALATGAGYFTDQTPELFRNLWSLAVEEQFYLLWPLLLPLVLRLPGARGRAYTVAIAALGSAAWMAVLAATGTDITRAYFGTDSHAFGLLLGAGLALALQPLAGAPLDERPAWVRRRRTRIAALGLGVIGLAFLIVVGALPQTTSIWTFPGGLLGASLATVLVIAAAVWPGTDRPTLFGRGLDARALRVVGERSYGLYLWHWPLLVLFTSAIGGAGEADTAGGVEGGGVPWWVGLAVLALTVACAEASFRFVETPIRRDGFRATARRVRDRALGEPQARATALAACIALLAALAGTGAAIAAAPSASQAQSVVQAGALAIQQAQAAPSPAPVPTTPPPVGTPATGPDISAVGDSVMLASAPALLERFPGIQIDAEVSRSMYAAPGILRALADRGELRPTVLVGLGTNGPIDRDVLDQIVAIAGPDRDVVFVNAFAERPWIAGVNDDLQQFAQASTHVAVADWGGAIAPHTDDLASDGIHPGRAGGEVYADAVSHGLDQVASARALGEQYDARRAAAEQLRRETLHEGTGSTVPR